MSENKKDKKQKEESGIGIDPLKYLGLLGKGVIKGVQWVGNAPENISNLVTDGIHAARDAMAVTEVIAIFNTTDHPIYVINREAEHDNREIASYTIQSMHTNQTDGVWIPWYDPPRMPDFSRRRLEIQVDKKGVAHLWQRGDYIYWTNEINERGAPATAFKMPGKSEAVGRRVMIFRYDPDFGYSVFFLPNLDKLED